MIFQPFRLAEVNWKWLPPHRLFLRRSETSIHLGAMPQHLLVVSLRVNLALASASWETVQTVPAKNPKDASIGNPYIVIALQVPDVSDRFEMILAPKM